MISAAERQPPSLPKPWRYLPRYSLYSAVMTSERSGIAALYEPSRTHGRSAGSVISAPAHCIVRMAVSIPARTSLGSLSCPGYPQGSVWKKPCGGRMVSSRLQLDPARSSPTHLARDANTETGKRSTIDRARILRTAGQVNVLHRFKRKEPPSPAPPPDSDPQSLTPQRIRQLHRHMPHPSYALLPSSPSHPTMASNMAATSHADLHMGPGESMWFVYGTTPERETSPTVGLRPYSPE